jgi:hypothetical protein
MDPAALKFLLDEIGRLFDEQNAKWDARFSQWNAKREPEPYLGDEVEAEEVAASDLREARDLEREEVEHAKLHEDRSQGAADAGREVALAARLLAADACAARIVDVAAPFDSYVPAYAAQFDGFNLDHAAFLGNGANSGLMGSAFFKEREEARRCMPSQDKLVIDLDPPDNIETSLSESAFHDVPGANYMEALTTCSTPGLTERAMDELIRMAQAGERLWVNTGGREVLHVDTYDSIFAKPGGSFLGPDVHVDTWVVALGPPSVGMPHRRHGRWLLQGDLGRAGDRGQGFHPPALVRPGPRRVRHLRRRCHGGLPPRAGAGHHVQGAPSGGGRIQVLPRPPVRHLLHCPQLPLARLLPHHLQVEDR